MIQSDESSHLKDLAERKLKEAADLTARASGTILPLLLFTLLVSWLLGLEAQIMPRFLEIRATQREAEGLEAPLRKYRERLAQLKKQHEQALQTVATATKAQKVKGIADPSEQIGGFPLVGGFLASVAQTLAEGADVNTQRKVDVLVERERRSANDMALEVEDLKKNVRNKELGPMLEKVTALAKRIDQDKTLAQNVEFRLPLINVNIPTPAAPLGWCILAMGTLLYVLRVRHRVRQLTAEARKCGIQAGVPAAHMDSLSDIRAWWLGRPPLIRQSGPAFRHASIALWFFWGILAIGSLRMICLGLHLQAFRRPDWVSGMFFVAVAGCVAIILSWLLSWMQLLPRRARALWKKTAGAPAPGRRRLLYGGFLFAAGTFAGYHVLRRSGPMPIADTEESLRKLKPGPHGSSVFSARRRQHTADLSLFDLVNHDDPAQVDAVMTQQPSAQALGAFVQNKHNNTLHYVFPQEAYAANEPKKFRKQGPRPRLPNPAPADEFIRWGSAPREFIHGTAGLASLFDTADAQTRLQSVPHVALQAAASSFEHFIIHGPLARGDIPSAIQFGFIAIRHDLARGGERPNFRIYDLTAGLLARLEDRAGLLELVRLAQTRTRHRPLFAHRVAKWLEPGGKWAARWKNQVAIVWAGQIITPALLK